MLITEERESINLFEQIIQQGKNSLKPQFKEITIEDREILNPYFDLVDYEACEYNFNTLYMWQHAYKTAYHIGDNFAVLVGEYEGEVLRINRMAEQNNSGAAVVGAEIKILRRFTKSYRFCIRLL